MAAAPSKDRVLPQNIEAERSLLASMMLDSDSVGAVVQTIRPGDFFAPEHRHIYEALLTLYNQNRPADVVMVADALARKDLLEAVGGHTYLATVVDAASSGVNAEHYASIVEKKAIRRQLIAAHAEALEESYGSGDDEDQIIDRAQHRIFEVAEQRERSHTIPIKYLLEETMRKVEALHERPDILSGIRTGFTELDAITSGLQPGELIILAARPSVGKTALARTICENVAIQQGRGVAFFSLEMAADQIALNMLCSRAKVNAHLMRQGMYRDDQWQDLARTADALSDTNIFVDDTAGLSPMQLRAKARRLRLQSHIELIVVDYLQLMSAPSAESRQQQIAEISRGLKALARDLTVPIIALSQLNRSVEQEKRRPRLSDLRESGAIEQDADVVLLLHREDYQQQSESDSGAAPNESVAEMIVAKQRNGPVGKLKLTFLKQFLRFENYTDVPEEAFHTMDEMTY